MGTYHTLFAATDADLDRLFPGWVPAKPERETVVVPKPFTKQLHEREVWVPVLAPKRLRRPNLYDDVWGPPVPSLLVPPGPWADYARSIEEACAPGLRALPHFRAKNQSLLYGFASLVVALGGEAESTPPARMGEPADDDMPTVERLPPGAALRLASLRDDQLGPTLLAWCRADPLGGEVEPTVEGVAEFIDGVLVPLRALARLAVARRASVCGYAALHP